MPDEMTVFQFPLTNAGRWRLKSNESAAGAVRVVIREGAPWFAARDVCRALGLPLEPCGLAWYLAGVPCEERDRVKLHPAQWGGVPDRGAAIISERGLEKILSEASSPRAQEFSRWVARTVAPGIRTKANASPQGRISLLEWKPSRRQRKGKLAAPGVAPGNAS